MFTSPGSLPGLELDLPPSKDCVLFVCVLLPFSLASNRLQINVCVFKYVYE